MQVYKGERIFIREISEEDITDRVMGWFENEKQMKFYTNAGTKIKKENLLDSIRNGKEKGDVFTFGAFDNASAELFGTIKIGPINKVHKTADLAILIGDRRFLGVGLAEDMIQLGTKVAFEEFDLRKLAGGTYQSNLASLMVYRAAGSIIEGRLKGHYFVDGKNEDRILLATFNPKYFTTEEINKIRENEHRYI
jgi:[ribosomal protein S5]-alanine N-acetyltransferase